MKDLIAYSGLPPHIRLGPDHDAGGERSRCRMPPVAPNVSARSFKEAFASSPFRERFERKGRFAGMLAKIPTCLILEESPALFGLAHLPLAG
jgi:hypothetical protein